MRRAGDGYAVIELYPDKREEIVQDALSLLEAEILYAMKIEDVRKPVAVDAGGLVVDRPKPNRARRLTFTF